MFSLCISTTDMLEPHRHPEAASMGYVMNGIARITILSPNVNHQLNTFELKPDDVYFVPRAYPHYIENTGDKEVKILIFFDKSIVGSIGYQGSFSAYSTEVLAATFQWSKKVSSKFGAYEFLVFSEILALNSNPSIFDYASRDS